jgi:hypothetical protein
VADDDRLHGGRMLAEPGGAGQEGKQRWVALRAKTGVSFWKL